MSAGAAGTDDDGWREGGSVFVAGGTEPAGDVTRVRGGEPPQRGRLRDVYTRLHPGLARFGTRFCPLLFSFSFLGRKILPLYVQKKKDISS